VEATDLSALIKPASDQQYCFSVAWSLDVAPRTVAVEFGGPWVSRLWRTTTFALLQSLAVCRQNEPERDRTWWIR
jgi:hypothetical protein